MTKGWGVVYIDVQKKQSRKLLTTGCKKVVWHFIVEMVLRVLTIEFYKVSFSLLSFIRSVFQWKAIHMQSFGITRERMGRASKEFRCY